MATKQPHLYGRYLHIPEPSTIRRESSNRELGADELAAILEELQPKSYTLFPLTQRQQYKTYPAISPFAYPSTPSLSSRTSDSSSSVRSSQSSTSLARSEPRASFFRRRGGGKAKRAAQDVAVYRKSPIQKLPTDVLVTILHHLRPSAKQVGSDLSVKDLLNASLACRDIYKACQRVLYHQVDFSPGDLDVFRKQVLSKKGTKLELLLRSFRNNGDLAQNVQHIRYRVNDPAAAGEVSESTEFALINMLDQCSNLTSITGLLIPCVNSSDGFHGTLSSLTKLSQLQCFGRSTSMTGSHGTSDVLYANLCTLTISCPGFAKTSESTRFSRQVSRLPALQNLLLQEFPSTFTNSHFRMLPLCRLRSLRLEHMVALDDDGHHATFSGLQDDASIVDLTLIDAGMSSTSTLVAVLENLRSLQRVTVLANRMDAPSIPSRRDLLSSHSVQHLHWQIQDPTANQRAFDLLAQSVASGSLPCLTELCAPFDVNGTLQAVCKPLAPPDMTSRVQPTGIQVPKSSVGMSMAYSRRAANARAAKALAPFRRKWIDEIGSRWDIIQTMGEGRLFSEERFDTASDTLGYIRLTVQDEDGRVLTISDQPKFLGRVQLRRAGEQAAVPEYILKGEGGDNTAVFSVQEWLQRRLS